jgi:GT2 family glycosyltransferase
MDHYARVRFNALKKKNVNKSIVAMAKEPVVIKDIKPEPVVIKDIKPEPVIVKEPELKPVKKIIKRRIKKTINVQIPPALILSQSNDRISCTLSVILLCWNKANYTEKCLQSVIDRTYCKNYNIIVVDNYSTDRTRTYLNAMKNKYGDLIQLVYNDKNYGFAKGMNIGVKHSKSEYVILLNNDTVVGTNWDLGLIDTISKERDVFAVMPLTNKCNNRARVDIQHSSPDDLITKFDNLDKSYLPESTESCSLILFCAIFRRQEYCDIGHLDEKYLNGWEDDDMYERIAQQGKQVKISMRSIIYHFGSATIGKNSHSKVDNPNKLYYQKKWNKQWHNPYEPNPMIITKNNKMQQYNGMNDMNTYLNANYTPRMVSFINKHMPKGTNAIQIDIGLYKYLHDIHTSDNNIICKQLNDIGIYEGKIYSIRQIRNLCGVNEFYKYGKRYYCRLGDLYVDLKLIAECIYDRSFGDLISDITELHNNVTQNNVTDTLVCSFIGDINIGNRLLDKILASDKKDLVNVIVIRGGIDRDKLMPKINMFGKRIVFISKEYGNDIIPTLQALYYCSIRYNGINNVYKLHTKSDHKWFNDCTNYLLDTKQCEMKFHEDSNCITHNKYLKSINSQKLHCRLIINKHRIQMDKKLFAMGTMFYSKFNVFQRLIALMKRNDFRSYFLNNMYDTNSVLLYNSPVHLLERLFGTICLDDSKISKKICIVYAYYERKNEQKNQTNLSHFIQYGLDRDRWRNMDITTLIIVNGKKCEVLIPERDDIIVWNREYYNEYDIGTYRLGIKHLENKYNSKIYDIFNYMLLINAGVFGPIYESGPKVHWIDPYIDKMSVENSVICTPIINFLKHTDLGGPGPRCQSYCSVFKLNKAVYDLLLHTKIKNHSEGTDGKGVPLHHDYVLTNHINHQNTVLIGEYGMTRIFLNNNFNISCLIYNNINYHDKRQYDNFSHRADRIDDYKEEYFNKVVFIKNNWLINPNLKNSFPVLYNKTHDYHCNKLNLKTITTDIDYDYNSIDYPPMIKLQDHKKIAVDKRGVYKCDCRAGHISANCIFSNVDSKIVSNTKHDAYNLFGISEEIVIWPKQNEKNNSVAIYCHYDKDDMSKDYVTRSLQSLIVMGYDIIFCTTSSKIDNVIFPFKVHYYKNKENLKAGNDLYMVHDIMKSGKLSNYEWITIVNDSILLPIHGIPKMKATIEKMRKDNDFWGLYLSNEHDIHICSCHIELNKKCLPQLIEFFNMAMRKKFANTLDLILNVEVKITSTLHSHGFKYAGVVTYHGMEQTNCLLFSPKNFYKYISRDDVFGIKWKYIGNHLDLKKINNPHLNYLLRYLKFWDMKITTVKSIF